MWLLFVKVLISAVIIDSNWPRKFMLIKLFMAKNNLILLFPILQLLARLLKSKNPEDLQAANRLIKNMVKQVMLSFCFLSTHLKSSTWSITSPFLSLNAHGGQIKRPFMKIGHRKFPHNAMWTYNMLPWIFLHQQNSQHDCTSTLKCVVECLSGNARLCLPILYLLLCGTFEFLT